MLLYVATLILITLCEVKPDIISEGRWSDMNNTGIDNIQEYCKNKNCMIKCCPDGRSIIKRSNNFICARIRRDYAEFNKYITSDNASREMKTSYFHFVQNDYFSDLNKNIPPLYQSNNELLKDGSIKHGSILLSRFVFCADLFHNSLKKPHRLAYKYVPDPEISDVDAKQLFTAVGMLISSFFMVLVLLVYAVLPILQNLVGMVLMAYLVSQSVGYILGAVQYLIILYPSASLSCSSSSPAFYFFMLSSFCWLNVMSLDLWWNLRSARKRRRIHRQGEHWKFFWYCVYAYGTPTLITLILVIVDKRHLYHGKKYRPPFESCFAEVFSTRLYMHLPIGIMTLINCVLFSMTVYNIWLIKRSIVTNNESKNTKREQNRFVIYMKLFIMTGASWVFEQIPTKDWASHVILNSLTLFNGVLIFYMFVCKKNIILMLCKSQEMTSSNQGHPFTRMTHTPAIVQIKDFEGSQKTRHISHYRQDF